LTAQNEVLLSPQRRVAIAARDNGEVPMSQWDIKGLETNFEGFRKDRYPSLSVSDAFERFAIRQVLKDADLSDDEIESGIFAGQDDGGVDGMYFFVNRALIQDETDLPDEALTAELVSSKRNSKLALQKPRLQNWKHFAKTSWITTEMLMRCSI
jgi:hypothetical protein